MKAKKIPQRLCLGCNQSKDKSALIRVVKTKDNQVFLDKTGKANGRGAYICNHIDCLQKAMKSGRISRALSCEISPEIYEQLKQAIADEE